MILGTAASGVLIVSVTIVAAISAVTRRRSAVSRTEVAHAMETKPTAKAPCALTLCARRRSPQQSKHSNLLSRKLFRVITVLQTACSHICMPPAGSETSCHEPTHSVLTVRQVGQFFLQKPVASLGSCIRIIAGSSNCILTDFMV